MNPQKHRLRRWIAGAVVGLMGVAVAVPANAATWDVITGTGSTWSQNALDQWRSNVAANYGMTVNYSGVGSSAGRRDFILGSVDYAVSEIPFQARPEDGSAPEVPNRGYAYMPIVAGGTAFMYHLNIGGKRVTNLRLSGETITKIFTGVITKWNDPQIAADNPGLAMPDKNIVPVVRSDGSGSTAQFTLWMSKQHPTLWNAFCASVGRPNPCGLTSQYPLFGAAKGQSQSSGVAGYVSQGYGEGAITYVEYSYALEAGFPAAKVLNSADYYVEPTADSVAVALMQAQILNSPGSPDHLTQILDGVYNNTDPRSYPLSSYSYMIVPTATGGVFTTGKGATLGTFASYMLCEGQQQAEDLGYSPLPMNLVRAGFDQIRRIPGAEGVNVDLNSCNNPTFRPGDSENNNQLALTAAQPAACDKRGPDQCVTGTAGAKQNTAVTGTGGGGEAANALGGGASGGGSNAGSTGGDGEGSALIYDDLGNVIGGGGSGGAGGGGVAGTAIASPFTLDEDRWGWQQSVMLGAVVLLLFAIALPPFISRRLRAAGTGTPAANGGEA